MRFDPFTPEAIEDPYPHYAALRAADPIHWSEKLRAWVLFRHADVSAFFRDDERLSADRAAGRDGARARPPHDRPRVRTVAIDPPEVLAVRAILMASLGPRVRTLEPRLDAMVATLLGGLAAATRAVVARTDPEAVRDFVRDFAYPLPIRVIAELLGVPDRDHDRFQTWSHAVARGMDRFFSSDDVAEGLRHIDVYVRRLVETARTAPGDDLVHGLLDTTHGGDRLTVDEVVALCTALVFGGHETTVNLFANGLLALLAHPVEAEALRSGAASIDTGVEELLRFDAPAQLISRTARRDFDWDGRTIRRGDVVLGCIGAANRDPAVFDAPDALVVRRDPNPHLAFGLGTHFCPGAQVSRLEGRVALPALLERFPRLRLAGSPTRRRTAVLRGLEHLPVRLD
jgi:cytochrome P450